MKKQKGITLVALVITIILLLILSGITIQSITNKGIISNTKRAELENKRGQIAETLQVRLITEQSNNPFGNSEEIISATRESVIKNIDEIKQFGKDVTVEEISKEEDFKQVDDYFYVVVDDDIYKVEQDGVKFIGKTSEMSPAIRVKAISAKLNSITVQVDTQRNEGGKLEYYIKKDSDENYKLSKTTTEQNYTYEDLEEETKYSIKIVAVAKNKKTAEVVIEKNTKRPVTDLTTANAKFTYSPSGWTNTNVVATASTDVKGFTIQTSKDGKTWASTSSQTLTSNGKVYARLWDGEDAGGMLTGNVTNIDKTAPTIGQISNGFTIVNGNKGTINITGIADAESGISGYHVNTTGTKPTMSNSWTTSTANSISYNVSSAGTYYFWVKDKVGNISEAKSCKISIVTAIAQVGTIYYSSISNAINAISTNGTVILLKDTTEDITIPENKTIILNLNQKKLEGTGAIRLSNKYDTTILNKGTLTIFGGSVTGNDWGIYNGGKLIINSGNYTAKVYEAICPVSGTTEINAGTITGGNYALCNYGGVTTINGGTFNGSIYDGIKNNGGTVNIKNGIFQGKNYGAYNEGGVYNISGGTYNGSFAGVGLKDGTITISGGSFSGERGVHSVKGTMTITGGTMRGNTYDGLSNYGATIYINGGNFSGKNWGIYSESGKIFYRRTDSQTSDQGLVSTEGWQAVSATDLTFY